MGVETQVVQYLRSNYRTEDGKLTPSAISKGVADFKAQSPQGALSHDALVDISLSALPSGEVSKTEQPSVGVFSGVNAAGENTYVDNKIGLTSVRSQQQKDSGDLETANSWGNHPFPFKAMA